MARRFSGSGGGGGASLSAPQVISATATGAIGTLRAGIGGTITYSKLSGNANITIASNGTISVTAALGAGVSQSAIARAASSNGSAVEKPITITGATTGTPVSPLTILFVGSSTPERYFTEFVGPANANVTMSTDGITFTPLGTTGAGGTTLGDLLQTTLGRPIKFISAGIASTTLAQWEVAGSTQRAAAVAAAANADLIVSMVGYNDARANGSVASQAAHETKLRSFFTKLRTELGKPTIPILIGSSQKLTTSDSELKRQIMDVRRAELAVSADLNNRLAAHSYDLAQQNDNIHQTQASYYRHATRIGNQILSVVNSTAQKRGPTITGIAAVSQTQTDVTLAHTTGADFTPTSGITGFEVSIDNFSSNLAISAAVRQTSTIIRLTHASTGGAAVKLRYASTAFPDTSGAVYGPTDLPMDYTNADFNIAAAPVLVPTTNNYFADTFIPGSDTNIDQHISDSGHTWENPFGNFLLSNGGIYGNTTGSTAIAIGYSSPTADQYVEADMTFVSSSSVAGFVLARATQDGLNFYQAGYRAGSGGWVIGKTIGGTYTELQSTAYTRTIPSTVRLRLECVGSTIKFFVNSVQIFSITDTDITAAGSIGVRNSSVASSGTAGVRFDNMAADQLVVPIAIPAPTTLGSFATTSDLISPSGQLSNATSTDNPTGAGTALRWTSANTSADIFLTPTAAMGTGLNVTNGTIYIPNKPIQHHERLLRFELQLHSAGTPASPTANYHTINPGEGPSAMKSSTAKTGGAGPGRWSVLGVPISDFDAVGTGADLSAIKFIRLKLRGDAAYNSIIEFGSPRFQPNVLTKAVAMFSTDDGYDSAYTILAPMFEAKGWNFMFNFGARQLTLNQTGKISTAMAAAMRSKGHQNMLQAEVDELLATHVAMSSSQQDATMQAQKDWWISLGGNPIDVGFGSYFSQVGPANRETDGMFQRNQRGTRTFDAARGVTAPDFPLLFGMPFPPPDKYMFRALATDSPTTLDHLKQHCEKAILDKGVAMFAGHNDYTNMQALLDWLDLPEQRARIDVVVERDLYRKYPY